MSARPPSLAFEKWEGLGNDFIVVDAVRVPFQLTDDVVVRLCDRHVGIGADGVLVVDTREEPPTMVVRNADGSRPEMCGNGLRCIGGYLSVRADATDLCVRTDAGLRRCLVERVAGAFVVDATMGNAREEDPIERCFEGETYRFASVNMGNPHAVTFAALDDDAFDRLARVVEVAVPGGTNVERVSDRGSALVVTVWERGVGYTRACGTGACAVAVAACRRGLRAYGVWNVVSLPGGDLEVLVDAETLAVRMRGPARPVFTGVVSLQAASGETRE